MANEFVARKGLLIPAGGASITGSLRISGETDSTGAVTASYFVGSGLYLTDVAATTVTFANVTGKPALVSSSAQFNTLTSPFSGSFTGSFKGDGTNLTGVTAVLPNGVVSSSTQLPNGIISSSTQLPSGIISSSTQLPNGLVSSSTQFRTLSNPFTGSFTGSFAGAFPYASLLGIPNGIISSSTQLPNGIISSSTQFPNGTVSSSAQIDVRNTAPFGLATLMTTGSNTNVGINSFTNGTNSTAFNNGTIVVTGGVGISQNLNVQGDVNVTGLLTAASASILYVTSSILTVGTNRVIVGTDQTLRWGGLSVYDSGSAANSGSLYWDAVNNYWITENGQSGANFSSSVVLAGPVNLGGARGTETRLTLGTIPKAQNTGYNLTDSSITDYSAFVGIDSPVSVTGSISSSVGFFGDGAGLTNIASTLIVSSSANHTTNGTIALKTQALLVSASNGIQSTMVGQTLKISGSYATTAAVGVAKFNSTNFAVSATGEVTSTNIAINGTNVTLGGTRNITLAQITAQGASTTDAVTLSTSAVINGTLYSGSAVTGIVGAVSNQVVATVPSPYTTAFFDYQVKSGTNMRAGTVIAVHDGTNVEYTDTSTADLGNTSQVIWAVDLSGTTLRLKFTCTSLTWDIKTAIRGL